MLTLTMQALAPPQISCVARCGTRVAQRADWHLSIAMAIRLPMENNASPPSAIPSRTRNNKKQSSVSATAEHSTFIRQNMPNFNVHVTSFFSGARSMARHRARNAALRSDVETAEFVWPQSSMLMAGKYLYRCAGLAILLYLKGK